MKISIDDFKRQLMDCFQDGDTIKWDCNIISLYNFAGNILSEYNTITEELKTF